MTDREAAEYWGVSRQWAHALRKRLGVPAPPTATQRVRHQVNTLLDRGLSPSEVARALGIPEARVNRIRPQSTERLAACGTRSAYHRHLRRGEPIDDACRAANNESASRRRKAAQGCSQ